MKRYMKIAVGVLATLTVLLGVCFYFIFAKVGAFFDETYKPIASTPPVKQIEVQKEEEAKALHVLLMGIDEREGDRGRPDVIIVAKLDPKQQTTKMVSISRDTKVTIPGKEHYTKLNHTYSIGDTDLTVRTVEELLGISIDYYVKVNMEGFEKIIQEFGSVTVQNERAFSFEEYSFSKGMISLESDEALAYVRMRKGDPLGDKGRNIRQRQVIEAVIHRLIQDRDYLGTIKLLETLAPYLEWNIGQKDLKPLYTHYLPALKEIQTDDMPGAGKIEEDGYWYFTPENPEKMFNE